MFQTGSPEHTAFEMACGIDKCRIIDAMEAVGSAPSFQLYDFATAEFDEIYPGDLTARDRLWIEGRYPTEFIDAWFRLAGVVELPGYSATIGALCERYLRELSAEIGSRKALRSNQELRDTIASIAKAELALANAIDKLRREAMRPRHAATARGDKVRLLYNQVQQLLISQLTPNDVSEDGQPSLQASLCSKITVEGASYYSDPPYLERALLRASRMTDGLARNTKYWAAMPDAPRATSRAKARWVAGLAIEWERMTGARATFTDTPRRSAFYLWIRCAHGHLTGLFRESGSDLEAGKAAAITSPSLHM